MRVPRGFTLIEIMVVLIILGTLSSMAMRWGQQKQVDDVTTAAAQDMADISSAIYRYRLDNGAWPANPGVLVPAYLNAADLTSVFDNAYTFTPLGPDIQVSVDALRTRFASPLAGKVRKGSVAGTTVTSRLVPPGAETSLLAKYSRDGSLPLTGALAGGNQDANDLNVVNANQFVDRAGGIVDPSGNSNLLGDLTVGGTLTAANLNATDINAGDDITAGDRITANEGYFRRVFDLDNPAYVWDGSGTSVMNNTRTNTLSITQDSVAGTACPSTDVLGLTSTGQLLTCRSGTWQSSGGYSTTPLWSGTLDNNGENAFLSQPITNFDQILIESYNQSATLARIHHFMDVGTIVYGRYYSIDATPVQRSQTNQTIEIQYISATRVRVSLTDGDAAIRSIRGVSFGG